MSNINILQDRTPAGEYRAVVDIATNGVSTPKAAHMNAAQNGISTIPVQIAVDAFGNPVGGATSSVTPTVATSQYTANTEVGAPMTFTGISGAIHGVTLAVHGTQTAGFAMYFFSPPPLTGTYADKSAAAPSAADLKKLVGVATFSAPTATPGLANTTIYTATTNIPVANAVGGVVGVLVTTGTPTFATAGDLTVTVQA